MFFRFTYTYLHSSYLKCENKSIKNIILAAVFSRNLAVTLRKIRVFQNRALRRILRLMNDEEKKAAKVTQRRTS
jgi:hypothetical protein